MNQRLQNFARKTLKEELVQCTERQQFRFKQMYAGGHLEMNINDVVDRMPSEKLDWAMQQVQNTLLKNQKEANQSEANHELKIQRFQPKIGGKESDVPF